MKRRQFLRWAGALTGTAALSGIGTWLLWPETTHQKILRTFGQSGRVPVDYLKTKGHTSPDYLHAPDGPARSEPWGLIASGSIREEIPAGVMKAISNQRAPYPWELKEIAALPKLGQKRETFTIIRLDHSTEIELEITGDGPNQSEGQTYITTRGGDQLQLKASRVFW
jgi:TAT (twin-arginine translocation) pathway signal sequence